MAAGNGELLTIRMIRSGESVPWGFRLQGGSDFSIPLSIQKVIPGSIAEKAGLYPGDQVCKIQLKNSDLLSHKQAQDNIFASKNDLELTIQRGGMRIWKPQTIIRDQNNNIVQIKHSLQHPNLKGNPFPPTANKLGVGHAQNSNRGNHVLSPPRLPNECGPATVATATNALASPTGGGNKVPWHVNGTGGVQHQQSAPGAGSGIVQSVNRFNTIATAGMSNNNIDKSPVPLPGMAPGHIAPGGKTQSNVAGKLALFNAAPKPFGYTTHLGSNGLPIRNTDTTPLTHNVPANNAGDRPSKSQNFGSNIHAGGGMVNGGSRPMQEEVLSDSSQGGVKAVFHAQYNSPINMYSPENVVDAFQGQTKGVLATGMQNLNINKPEKSPPITESATYKLIHDQMQQQQRLAKSVNPIQSGSFKRIEDYVSDHSSDNSKPPTHGPVCNGIAQPNVQHTIYPPQNLIHSSGSHLSNLPNQYSSAGSSLTPSPAKFIECSECSRPITGVFVKLNDERLLHPDCFKCSTCGTSLKTKGYYAIHEKLYCEVHARVYRTNSGANTATGPTSFGTVPLTNGYLEAKPSHKLPHNGLGENYSGSYTNLREPVACHIAPGLTPQSKSLSALKKSFDRPLSPGCDNSYNNVELPENSATMNGNYRAPWRNQEDPNPNNYYSSIHAPLGNVGADSAQYSMGHIKPSGGGMGIGTNQHQAGIIGAANAGIGGGAAESNKTMMRRGHGIFNESLIPGVKAPICEQCQNFIRGPYISALNKAWCPNHFQCSNPSCRTPLQTTGFVEEKGKIYCESCYEKYFAPRCSKCGRPILGDCLNALDKPWHPECFSCAHCHKPFGNSTFYMENGQPYCERDWNNLFTIKCDGCRLPIEANQRWVEALNKSYHSNCFVCTVCHKPLEGQSFFAKDNLPFCKLHALR